jgi:hypothetical protein
VKLDPNVVKELVLRFEPTAYLRVMAQAHAATPLGMGFGQSRFSAPGKSFRLIYIAYDLATAIAETIIRDRFEAATDRVLDRTEIEEWAVAEVSAIEPLTVVDLRTTGLLKLGVSTDAARAKDQAVGRRLSKEIYDRFEVDGVLYASRLTSAPCLAVYDRAVNTKLRSSPATNLLRHGALVHALKSISVSVRGTA